MTLSGCTPIIYFKIFCVMPLACLDLAVMDCLAHLVEVVPAGLLGLRRASALRIAHILLRVVAGLNSGDMDYT